MKPNRLVLLAVGVAAFVAVAGTTNVPVIENKGTKPAVSTPTTLSKDDQEALLLGRKVLAVQRALQNPTAPDAMQAVLDLGLDQRYYVMTRGWLTYQLSGDQSIISASKGSQPRRITDRAEFVKKAIRRIDLE
jgi:hypothetical protein